MPGQYAAVKMACTTAWLPRGERRSSTWGPATSSGRKSRTSTRTPTASPASRSCALSTATTPLLRCPPGSTIASSSGGRAGTRPGIDVRGPGRRSGGYLIGPGSIVNDIPYVITRDTAIAQLPGWLTELLTAGEHPQGRGLDRTRRAPDQRAAPRRRLARGITTWSTSTGPGAFSGVRPAARRTTHGLGNRWSITEQPLPTCNRLQRLLSETVDLYQLGPEAPRS